jgi:hypothetical protein
MCKEPWWINTLSRWISGLWTSSRTQAQSNSMTNSLLTKNLIWTPSRCYVRKYHDEKAIERRMLKAVEIDQVNWRFVLLLRWMKIIFAKRRMLAFAAILIWIYGNMKRMLRVERNIHTISTIRVNFEWTKHIRKLKPKIYKKTLLSSSLYWYNWKFQSSRSN